MRKTIKWLSRRPPIRRLLCWLAANYIRLVRITSSWDIINIEATQEAWAGKRPVILAFWHNRLLLMPYCWQSNKPFYMLVSAHSDGQLIAETIARLGLSNIAGSSTRGGTDALRSLIRHLKAGQSIGITPDGPRGPRMRAGAGAITVARLSGAVILPACAATSRRHVLSTWDRLVIGLPFSNGVLVWGNPISVPHDSDEATMESLRLQLENSLTWVSRTADEAVGQPSIEPAHMGSQADRRARA